MEPQGSKPKPFVSTDSANFHGFCPRQSVDRNSHDKWFFAECEEQSCAPSGQASSHREMRVSRTSKLHGGYLGYSSRDPRVSEKVARAE
jgi:hypothetical protein